MNTDRLEAWRVANRLAVELYRISTVRWQPWASPAWDQAKRAALSVPLNIAEGYAWRPSARWKYHLQVANGSAVETYYAVRFLGEIGAVDQETAARLSTMALVSKRLVWALLRSA